MMGSFLGDGGWFGFFGFVARRKRKRAEARKRRGRSRAVAMGVLVDYENGR